MKPFGGLDELGVEMEEEFTNFSSMQVRTYRSKSWLVKVEIDGLVSQIQSRGRIASRIIPTESESQTCNILQRNLNCGSEESSLGDD